MDRIERYRQLLERHVRANNAPAAARVLERMAELYSAQKNSEQAHIHRERAMNILNALPSFAPDDSSHDLIATILPFPDHPQTHPSEPRGSMVTVDFEKSHLMRRIHAGDPPGGPHIICYKGPGHDDKTGDKPPAPQPLRLYRHLTHEANRLRALGVWFIRKKEWEQARECLLRSADISREINSVKALAHTLWFLGQACIGLAEDDEAHETEQEIHEVVSSLKDPQYHYLARLLTLRLALNRDDALQIVVAFAGFVKIAEETPRAFVFSHPPYATLKSLVDYFIALRDFTMAKEAVNQLKKLAKN
ncbi:tetratricopeptide repeat protein, partial [Myxococcota bacterium]|nr:tetratricopeptide repeat protein [Myxococcota bacterium]